MGPLHFSEIFKEKVWGGRNLAALLGKNLPEGLKIGESWELSDFGDDCTVVSRGEHKGKNLRDLLAENSREVTGRDSVTKFGLLFKYLDAVGSLSLQVHPNKQECWYILQTEPGAKLYLGLKEGVGRSEFRSALAEGTVQQCLAAFEPSPGQCYYLPSGLTHALGAGIVVAEIQTSEQITYRVYDWGRDRPIQVQLSLDTINFQARPKCAPAQPELPGQTQRLVDEEHFSVDKCVHAAGETITIQPGQEQVWMVIDGQAHYEYQGRTEPIELGNTVLFPACWSGNIEIDQQTCVLVTKRPPKKSEG